MLLHAGQRIDRPALRVPLIARTIRGRELTTGAVIGVARLVDCHQDPEGLLVVPAIRSCAMRALQPVDY
jgi:hypothetical protein